MRGLLRAVHRGRTRRRLRIIDSMVSGRVSPRRRSGTATLWSRPSSRADASMSSAAPEAHAARYWPPPSRRPRRSQPDAGWSGHQHRFPLYMLPSSFIHLPYTVAWADRHGPRMLRITKANSRSTIPRTPCAADILKPAGHRAEAVEATPFRRAVDARKPAITSPIRGRRGARRDGAARAPEGTTGAFPARRTRATASSRRRRPGAIRGPW